MPALDPLIAESSRTGSRIRLVLRSVDGDDKRERIVEGIVQAIIPGRDGRQRLRMGIPTGSGDPVEVRVLLESIERVERVDAPAKPTTPDDVSRKPTVDLGTKKPTPSPAAGVPTPGTGAHRRATLMFGSSSGTHPAEVVRRNGDSWDDATNGTPRRRT